MENDPTLERFGRESCEDYDQGYQGYEEEGPEDGDDQ